MSIGGGHGHPKCIRLYELSATSRRKRQNEDFMNHYQLYCISRRKRQMLLRRLRIIAAKESELLQPYYSEEMRNIELLLPLLFKKDMQNIYYCSYL
jgi:hypothetical protein